MHISNPAERKWFRDRVEKADDFKFTQNGKEAILNKLYKQKGLKNFYILNMLELKDLV